MTDNKDQFEATKSGIKIPYLRFLSDSASGYIAILMLLFLYYYKICNVYVPDMCNNVFHISELHIDISKEVEIFVLILLFLLATPLGLFINASSWALLGKLQLWSEKRWVASNSFPINGTKKKFLFDYCKDYFNFDKEDFYVKSKFIEENLRIDYPDSLRYLDHIEGVKNFSRSILLLLIFVFLLHIAILIYYLVCLNFTFGILLHIGIHLVIILFFSFLIITILSIFSFYYDSYITFMGYLLYSERKYSKNRDILDKLNKIDEFYNKDVKNNCNAEKG